MPHITIMECQLKLAGYTIVTVTIPGLTYLWTSGRRYLWMLVLKKCVKDLGFRIDGNKIFRKCYILFKIRHIIFAA